MEFPKSFAEEPKANSIELDNEITFYNSLKEHLDRLIDSHKVAGRYRSGMEAKMRSAQSKERMYDEGGIVRKTYDYILEKFGKDTEHTRVMEYSEDAHRLSVHREGRLKKQRELRIKLAESVMESMSDFPDIFALTVVQNKLGVKVVDLLSDYTSLLSAGEDNFEVERRLQTFMLEYRSFIAKLGELTKKELALVVEFIRQSDFSYELPENILRNERSIGTGSESGFSNFGLKNLVLIHKTNYVPQGQIRTSAGMYIPMERDEADRNKEHSFHSFRGTISLSINAPVVDHMEGTFSNRDYAILIPFESVAHRVINMRESDAAVFGNLKLENTDTTIIISYKKSKELSESEIDSIRKDSGADKVVIGKEGESINDTIVRVMSARGFTYIPQDNNGFADFTSHSREGREASQRMIELADEYSRDYQFLDRTVFISLERFLSNAFHNFEDTNEYADEFLRKVDEHIESIKVEIKSTGRELDEDEVLALENIRQGAVKNIEIFRQKNKEKK